MPDRFDLFTEEARAVLTDAQREAIDRGYNYIGTEHLLLAILRTQSSAAMRLLVRAGADPAKMRQDIDLVLGSSIVMGSSSPAAVSGEIGLTPGAKKVIEGAVEEGRRRNDAHIGSEHLLLGLMREGQGIGFGVLEANGLSVSGLRAVFDEASAQNRQREMDSARDAAKALSAAVEGLREYQGGKLEMALVDTFIIRPLESALPVLEMEAAGRPANDQQRLLVRLARSTALEGAAILEDNRMGELASILKAADEALSHLRW